MDFIIQNYSDILQAIVRNNYEVQTFSEYLQNPSAKKTVILRHDVDRTPVNALKMAELEHAMGLHASYFFRSHAHVFVKEIIEKVKSLGHEIGYHYENLSDSNGDFELAIQDFDSMLKKFREITPVKTICMHGSPLSRFNNQSLWKKYNYEDFGIIGEPYFTVDFNKVAYITDAGRKWNDDKVNFRDKVNTTMHFDLSHSNDIIKLLDSKDAPEAFMINIHPHNWAFSSLECYKTYLWQGFKNSIKAIIHTLDKRD